MKSFPLEVTVCRKSTSFQSNQTGKSFLIYLRKFPFFLFVRRTLGIVYITVYPKLSSFCQLFPPIYPVYLRRLLESRTNLAPSEEKVPPLRIHGINSSKDLVTGQRLIAPAPVKPIVAALIASKSIPQAAYYNLTLSSLIFLLIIVGKFQRPLNWHFVISIEQTKRTRFARERGTKPRKRTNRRVR